MVFAIIPARAGSKRIKNKNIINFFNKPIIAWTIETLKKLKKKKIINKIVITSDSNKILNISKKYGADILIKRVKNLSNDKAPFQLAIQDAIKHLDKNGYSFREILVIFPCSILVDKKDIISALKIYRKKINSFIITIGKFSHPPQRGFIKTKENKLHFVYKKNELKNTQSFQEQYFDAGQFYIGDRNLWKKKKVHSNAKGYLLSKTKFIDLDTKEDLNFLRYLFKKIK
jgi:pseudaminic acid cytidylyltransferase